LVPANPGRRVGANLSPHRMIAYGPPGRLSPLLLHPNSGAFRALPLSLPGDGQVSNHSLTSLYEHGKKFEMFTESQPFDMIEFRPFEIFKDLASVSAWVLGKGFDLQTVLSVRGTR
jgi:hypothetical protein